MSASDRERYSQACHAMQTGVAASGAEGTGDQSPKHLRVGVNAAMSGHGALVKLLINTGVITLEAYEKVLADYMEREVRSYEAHLSAKHGRKVSLA